MARRSVTVGDGITAREAISLDDLTVEDARSIGESFRAASAEAWDEGGGTSFGMNTVDQIAICRSILEKAGSGKHPVDSPAYFARWYIHLHAAAQKHIADGNADLAALTAWDAGMIFTRADMKWRWEKFALSGSRTAQRLNDESKRANHQRQKKAHATWRDWEREASRVEAGRPDIKSKTRIAQCVIARLRLSEKPDTVARAIKKVRMAL